MDTPIVLKFTDIASASNFKFEFRLGSTCIWYSNYVCGMNDDASCTVKIKSWVMI